jgi:hypothetical protein
MFRELIRDAECRGGNCCSLFLDEQSGNIYGVAKAVSPGDAALAHLPIGEGEVPFMLPRHLASAFGARLVKQDE